MPFLSKLFGFRAAPRPAAKNPALNHLRQLPLNPITQALIAVLNELSEALYSEANKAAATLGVKGKLFAECILDLELLGGFNRVVEFTGDNRLASTYMDAIIFEMTGKDPSLLPTDFEFLEGGTEQYRGIAKYAMAKDYFKVSSPEAWLFGKEYSTIRTGSAKDFAYIVPATVFVPTIIETGSLIFNHFLPAPSRDELDPSGGEPQGAISF